MSSRIAVISDTHGVLRPEVLEKIAGCDAVIHAGDFDTPEILEHLEKLIPVYAVRGNNDGVWAAGRLHERLAFQIEKLHFLSVHDRRSLPRDLNGIDVIVFGHTHQYAEYTENGRLFFNPGSCGRRRFGQELSFAILTIDVRSVSAEKIMLKQSWQDRFAVRHIFSAASLR
ncbi:MAG: metallophosphoesterase family protein [Desulfovibrionaceae bacterium]|nr:metallophosphoesterase family protein [Desulfovibrionaceae bacterium]